jgi:hypothetical protein
MLLDLLCHFVRTLRLTTNVVLLRALHTSSGALFHLIQRLLRIASAEVRCYLHHALISGAVIFFVLQLDAPAPRCPRQHVHRPAPKSILHRS